MPQKNRQRAVQRARAERIRAAQEQATARRKRLIGAGAVVVVLALIAIAGFTFVGGGDDKTDVATSASSTSTPQTSAPAGSAAGKPCVAPAGPLPEGAPEVPVKVGPPPEKLIMEDITPGTGAVVAPESTVNVNYIGVACSTGKVFDSSYKTGTPTPISFPLTGVIPGWTQGIPGMKVGGTRLLGIPSALAYGPQGQGADIGPDEPLWFVVEVLDAKPTP